MKELGGLVLLLFLGIALMGGCDEDSTPTPEYSTSTNVTDNNDGSSTYHSKDNYGSDFTCTFEDDGSSHCSGTP